jgi:hypothetical protein
MFWKKKKIKKEEVYKMYNGTSSVLVNIYVFNLLSFPLKPAEQATTQYTLLFSQYYKKNSRVYSHDKIHSSQKQYITSITIHFL